MSREEVFRATGPAGRRDGAREVRRDARRPLSAGSARMWYEAGAFPGSPVQAGAMTVLRAVRARALRDRRLRRGGEQAEDGGLPRARRAAGRLRGGVAARRAGARSSASIRSSCASRTRRARARRRPTARASRRSAWSRRSRPRARIRTTRRRSARTRAAASPSASGSTRGMSSSAELHLTEDGTAVVAIGQPRHRRLARLARDHGGGGARHRRRRRCGPWSATPSRSATPT